MSATHGLHPVDDAEVARHVRFRSQQSMSIIEKGELMHHRTIRSFALLVTASVLVASCASSTAYKNRYASSDFEMSYLDSGKTDADVMVARVEAELASVDKAFSRIDSLAAKLPGPVGSEVKGAVDSIESTMNGAIKGKILAAVKGEQKALAMYLKSHNVFAAKDHPYGYNLIDQLEGEDADTKEANALIMEINAVLKDAYKVSAAVAVSKELVAMLKTDLTEVKAEPTAVKVAGIGLLSMSVSRNTLNSVGEAQALLPRLQALLSKTQAKLTAKPTMAFKLGSVPGQLTSASAGLAAISKDGPELLGNLAGLATELGKL